MTKGQKMDNTVIIRAMEKRIKQDKRDRFVYKLQLLATSLALTVLLYAMAVTIMLAVA